MDMKTTQKITLTALAFLFMQFCSSSTGGGGSAENEFIDVTGPTSIEKNLATTGTATITVTAKDFDGDVQLELDRSKIDDEFQAGTDIELSLSTDQVTVVANQSQAVTLTYTIKGSAPSFKSKLTINLTIPSKNETLKVEVPFEVRAIYESRLYVTAGVHEFDKPLIENFRAHEGDLKLIFINMDPLATHRIHSSPGSGAAFDHQDVDMTAAASEGEDGGTYEVIADQSGADTSYYCHTHGTGDGVWVMTFNN